MRMNERTDWTDAWPFVHCFVCVFSARARVRTYAAVVEKREKKNVDIYARPTVVSCCLIWTTCSDMYISPVFWPSIDLFLFLSFFSSSSSSISVLFLSRTRRLYTYSNTDVCASACVCVPAICSEHRSVQSTSINFFLFSFQLDSAWP